MSKLSPVPRPLLFVGGEEIQNVPRYSFLLALRELVQLDGNRPVRVPVSKAVCPGTRENAPGSLIAFSLSRYFAQRDCAPKSAAYGYPVICRRPRSDLS